MIDCDFNNLLSKSGVVLQKIKILVTVIKNVFNACFSKRAKWHNQMIY